jgi:2-polyprenyl-6-hydroxyphenyl methylase/3-demethylubiquinone-9 3-methyltransferase
MSALDLRVGARRALRGATEAAQSAGRRIGLLAYRPERWSTAAWTDAYASGQLDYYGELDELARYSVLVGYVGWSARSQPEPPRVLDVGCGTGLLRRLLDGMSWSEYVGLDLSEAAIESARTGPTDRSQFVVGDVMTLDLGRFDIIVVNEVLYYAADPRAFLARMRAALSPGGVLLISMWRHAGDRQLWKLVDEVVPILDRVEVRNRANAINARGWVVACCGPLSRG